MTVVRVETGYEGIANCYLLTDEKSGEAAVIDPGAYDGRGELDSVVEELGCTVKYILLTHGHFDHILGVRGVRDSYGAMVAIHEEDAECLMDTAKSLAQDNGLEHLQRSVRTDVLFQDGDVLKLGETEIKVIHTPGHTRGSVCFLIEEEKLLITGDTLFCMTVGRTDFPGGSREELTQSLKKLLALEGDYRVLPGHNRETTLDRERVRNYFIRRM